jgi:hypothetical protein
MIAIFYLSNLQQEHGKPLEYAVKMLEIPQKFRMDYLIKVDKVSLKSLNLRLPGGAGRDQQWI